MDPTPGQMMQMSAVYGFLARLLPTEGRDYAVRFSFGGGSAVSVRFEPYTEIGRIWCDYCTKELRSQKQAGSAGKDDKNEKIVH